MTATPRSERSVAGLTLFITGAASGMGRAAASLFASEGAKVALSDLDGAGAGRVADEIAQAGGTARAWTLDVTNGAAIAEVTGAAAAAFDGIDLLINNAGIALPCPIDDAGYDEAWTRSLSVLLTAQQRIIRACLPHLRRSANPRIINIASTEALGATGGHSSYAAAKAGVTGLTRALAVELGPAGITVNAICPGPILTGMTEMIPEEARNKYARRNLALQRYGTPEEVAQMMLSLALPGASFVTGVALPVDGGLTIRNA